MRFPADRAVARLVLGALVATLAVAASAGAAAAPAPVLARFELAPGGPKDLAPLLARVADAEQFAEPFGDPDAADDERVLRRLQQTATEVLSTEGYFAPRFETRPGTDGSSRYVLAVDPGRQARVVDVAIDFAGPIAADAQRVDELRGTWELPRGHAFRDADWTVAKRKLLARVQQRDFAAARLTASSAIVDAGDAAVRLRIEIDSGPRFTLGALEIHGLGRYDRELVARYSPFHDGDAYDAARLLDFQQRLQASGYFATVLVDVATDPDQAQDAPIRVDVTEAKTRRVALAGGYSTNVGPQAEATYRQSQLFGRPYTLQSGIGVDHTRGVGYADIYLPPRSDGGIDSVGILAERTDVNAVATHRSAAGATRRYPHDSGGVATELKFGVNVQREATSEALNGIPTTTINDVVYGSLAWSRRAVDQPMNPTRGDTLALEGDVGISHASLTTLINDTFWRGYGRYLRYVPLSPNDQLLLRAELGLVFSDDASRVPTTLLFRAGGSGSVRGYGYQSLGLQSAGTTLYSPDLAVASIEYVHWFGSPWGVAVFHDHGGAGDDIRRMAWGRGTGFGARWRSIAGPLALDLAYGDRLPGGLGGRWRLHFSVLVAF